MAKATKKKAKVTPAKKPYPVFPKLEKGKAVIASDVKREAKNKGLTIKQAIVILLRKGFSNKECMSAGYNKDTVWHVAKDFKAGKFDEKKATPAKKKATTKAKPKAKAKTATKKTKKATTKSKPKNSAVRKKKEKLIDLEISGNVEASETPLETMETIFE